MERPTEKINVQMVRLSVITVNVHNRDVVQMLIDYKIESAAVWESDMRHRAWVD